MSCDIGLLSEEPGAGWWWGWGGEWGMQRIGPNGREKIKETGAGSSTGEAQACGELEETALQEAQVSAFLANPQEEALCFGQHPVLERVGAGER